MSSIDAFKILSDQAEVRIKHIRMVGTGASAPTKLFGRGATLTRTSTGLYKVTWDEKQGTYLGVLIGLEAATPANIAGHTLVADTYDTSAFSQEFLFSGATEVAHDLAADEYINLAVLFKATSV